MFDDGPQQEAKFLHKPLKKEIYFSPQLMNVRLAKFKQVYNNDISIVCSLFNFFFYFATGAVFAKIENKKNI